MPKLATFMGQPLKKVVVGTASGNPIEYVPVVRCKDCIRWKPSGGEVGDTLENMEPIGGCKYVKYFRKASDFCSYGERRNDNG